MGSRRSAQKTFIPRLFRFCAIGAIALALATGGGYLYFRSQVSPVVLLKSHYPWVRYQGKGKPPRVSIQKGRPPGWVSVGAVSRVAVGAIIVSEDWAFYQHNGFDVNQIKEAIEVDWEAGRFVRGASTITQQVAKNVFLERDKTLWRKLREVALATEMEEKLGKRKILELYLNVAEWGEGIYGISRASRHYFQKSPSELTAREGAFLAMLLPSPKRYSVSFRARKLTTYARDTIEDILYKMTQARYLTKEERDMAMVTPLPFEQF